MEKDGLLKLLFFYLPKERQLARPEEQQREKELHEIYSNIQQSLTMFK
jgi:hypothetical protein